MRALIVVALVPVVAASAAAWAGDPLARGPALPTFTEAEARRTGPGHPWQGGPAPANPYSLAKQTTFPIVTWTARGGMPVAFALHHNSRAAWSNPAIGRKWTHSFDVFLLPYIEQDAIPRMGVYWGSHVEQRFQQQGGQWVPLDGYRDALQTTPGGAVLTLRDHTRLEFFATSLAGRPAYRLDRILDPSSNEIDLVYDGLNRLVTVRDPVNRRIELTYDGTGRLDQVQYVYGSSARTWDLAFANEMLAQVVYPPVTTDACVQVYVTACEYDGDANIVRIQDRAGQVWQYGYEPLYRNRLAWEQWPGNTPAQRLTYTQSFVPGISTTTLIDPRGVQAHFSFDSAARLVELRDAAGNAGDLAYLDGDYPWAPSSLARPSGTTSGFDYDARGNLVRTISPAGHATDYAYDTANNLVQVLQPLVTDAWGVTEPARRRTDFVYDAQDRLIERRRMTQPGGFDVWAFAYNAFGQLTQATDPLNQTTAYEYDPTHFQLVRATTPGGRTFRWIYDTPDATFGSTLPNAVIDGLGGRTELLRDEWGRLRVKDYPTSANEGYSYDGLSRLVRAQDAGGVSDWTYTAQGWLASHQRGAQLVQYAYAPNGLLESMLESGVSFPRAVQYQYGPRNELVTLVDDGAPITHTWDADLRLVRRALPNGASVDYAYQDGRLASIVHGSGSFAPVASFTYAYQSNGQRMRADELNGSTVRYGYDFLDRLVREERTGAVPYRFDWTYDRAGRRLTQVQDGLVHQYSHDPDGLLAQLLGPMGLWTYDWDGDARLVRRTQPGVTDTFLYDDAGRLVHADHAEQGFPLAPWRDYAYDALGRRSARMAFTLFGQPDTQTSFFHPPSTPFREEQVSFQGGPPSTSLPTFAGGLVRWRDAATGQSMYPATDADGSVRAWTDNSGAPGSYVGLFNAFGQSIVDQGPRPPYSFGADSGLRSDGDFGWLVLDDRQLYSPLELIHVGSGSGVQIFGADQRFQTEVMNRLIPAVVELIGAIAGIAPRTATPSSTPPGPNVPPEFFDPCINRCRVEVIRGIADPSVPPEFFDPCINRCAVQASAPLAMLQQDPPALNDAAQTGINGLQGEITRLNRQLSALPWWQ